MSIVNLLRKFGHASNVLTSSETADCEGAARVLAIEVVGPHRAGRGFSAALAALRGRRSTVPFHGPLPQGRERKGAVVHLRC